jgi:hypothetical protein
MSEENKFTIAKATQLLQSFSGLMKDGCVSLEVYQSRRSACEGCEHNQERPRDKKRFCGSCGCGTRDLAALYDPTVSLADDKSVRLWMPKSNCPKGIHKDELGTGDFSPVGGRIKQLVAFTKATLAEAVGSSNADDQLDAVSATADAVKDIAKSEEEIDEVAKEMENDQ